MIIIQTRHTTHRGHAFLPFAITTFGGIGPSHAWAFINTLFSRLDPASSTATLRLTRSRATAIARLTYLAAFQATLITSTFRMLSAYTADAP